MYLFGVQEVSFFGGRGRVILGLDLGVPVSFREPGSYILGSQGYFCGPRDSFGVPGILFGVPVILFVIPGGPFDGPRLRVLLMG